MNIYDAWANFLESGSVLDYLRYAALKNSKEDFPEYFEDDTENTQEDDDENIDGWTDNRGTGHW